MFDTGIQEVEPAFNVGNDSEAANCYHIKVQLHHTVSTTQTQTDLANLQPCTSVGSEIPTVTLCQALSFEKSVSRESLNSEQPVLEEQQLLVAPMEPHQGQNL